jgi:hypothetical protein
MKKLIQAAANAFGYEIRRSHEAMMKLQTPIEISELEREILDDVMSNGLTLVSYERLWATLLACKYVVDRGIDGDFVECGVWRGGNAIVAARYFELNGIDKNVWCFDTFEGMTRPTAADVTHTGRPAIEEFVRSDKGTHNDWGYVPLEAVRENFAKRGLLSKVRFVKGDVLDTLSQEKEDLPSEISILRLDTDWYESTQKELDVLYPLLLPGGVILLDDYGVWSGSRNATDEYFQKHQNRPLLQRTDFDGRAGVKTI